jgi:mannosyl-3-phosphoglycerate phosphatase
MLKTGQVFQVPVFPLLVYTDLDGTLLDKHSYSHAPAMPALEWLKKLHIPVIPVSSKTLVELEHLAGIIGLPYPCIAENGALIAVPKGYFAGLENEPLMHGYHVLRDGAAYADILARLAELRERHGYAFRGFHDMSVEEVAELTSLDLPSAERARQRLCSEPLVWQGDEQTFAGFREHLLAADLRIVKGGRFWHVMNSTDKGQSMLRLNRLYRQAGFERFSTIALGDSPNDMPMLQQADVAVVIRRADGSCMMVPGGKQVFYSREIGPQGWNEFMLSYLDKYAREHPPGLV